MMPETMSSVALRSDDPIDTASRSTPCGARQRAPVSWMHQGYHAGAGIDNAEHSFMAPTPADLYPHSLQEWIALASVLIPFIGLALGAVWRAWTYHREQKQKEWERLHELLKTL